MERKKLSPSQMLIERPKKLALTIYMKNQHRITAENEHLRATAEGNASPADLGRPHSRQQLPLPLESPVRRVIVDNGMSGSVNGAEQGTRRIACERLYLVSMKNRGYGSRVQQHPCLWNYSFATGGVRDGSGSRSRNLASQPGIRN
jgi:hypothetical protein